MSYTVFKSEEYKRFTINVFLGCGVVPRCVSLTWWVFGIVWSVCSVRCIAIALVSACLDEKKMQMMINIHTKRLVFCLFFSQSLSMYIIIMICVVHAWIWFQNRKLKCQITDKVEMWNPHKDFYSQNVKKRNAFIKLLH